MQRRSLYLAIAALTAAALASPLAAYAQAYPSRAIKLIVPFPPGGSTDVAGRVLGQSMAKSLGQPIVVDNRAGAAGAIGIDAVAKAPADGYTLGVAGAGPIVILPLLGRKLPYTPEKDLMVVGHMGALPLVIVGKPTLAASNVAELITLAKAQPGRLAFGSSGNGTPGHLAFEYLKSLAGIDMVHVPYKGDAPLTTDVMGNQLDVGVLTVAAAVAQAQGGKLKMLGVTSARRSEQLPNVPTVAESGVANFEADVWYVMVAPAATPPEVVARLNAALNIASGETEVRKQLGAQGLSLVPMQIKAVDEFVRKENAKWATVVERANIKLD
jgi:tripartite-type tricarboxylate transporter receptor subunit TctC